MKSVEKILRYTGVFIITIYLATCFFKVNGFFSNKKSEIIKSDGLGYYSYLPSLFIYGNFTQDFLKKNFADNYLGTGIPEYVQMIDGKPVDKYFFGTAVLMYPFFMTAHLLSLFFHQPADGYSFLYQYFMGLSAIFYVLIGIFFCDKLLRRYQATTFQSIFICSMIVFATNIYYYTVVEPTMSHVYSFAMISAFLYFSKSFFSTKKSGFILPAFIALGFIIIIRPFNALIVLSFPFLAGSFENLKSGVLLLLKNRILTLTGTLLTFLIVSLQLLIWYKQSGHFIVYSYTTERFYFDKPNILNVLISYRKGLFIYTPLCFLGLFGFIQMFRQNRFAAISLFLFLFMLVYIMGCWHQWFYGASFGFRPMIDFFSLFTILLLFSMQLFKKIFFKTIFIATCFFLLYVNQVQGYQYRTFILHWDKMSKYKYWKVFLKTDEKWMGYVWANPEPTEIGGVPILTFANDFEKPSDNWDGRSILQVGKEAHSGTTVTAISDTSAYSNTLFLNKNKRELASGPVSVTGFGYIKSSDDSVYDEMKFTITFNNINGETYFYLDRPIDNYTENKNGWRKFEIGAYLDKLRSDSDVVKIYFWNPKNRKAWIDDVSINIFNTERPF